MDRETLFRNLNRRYCSKREMLSRIPLGVQPDAIWQELLHRRRAQGTVLQLYGNGGMPYWYVTTDKMIGASEKIVETLYADSTEFDPYAEPLPVMTLEESFFTSYVEGSQITMQAAMEFLSSDHPPRDIEEQMIVNNRTAGKFAAENLYRSIDAECLRTLAYILTDGMDNGGRDYRTTDGAEYTAANHERFMCSDVRLVPERVEELCAFLASPQTHPLIKAGIAQGYMMFLRPFPEGNDRIGRILSSMLLLRAGYTFFSDVSLSALIARKSYAYYEATANILREENGGDLTYFLEFFLELLSRAVDERALRQQRRNDQDLQAEQEKARTALTASAIPAPLSFQDEPIERPPQPPEPPELPPAAESPGEEIIASSIMASEVSEHTSEENMNQIQDLLLAFAGGTHEGLKSCAKLLLRFINEGKYTFTQAEFCDHCGFDSRQAARMMFQLREKGIIVSSGSWEGRYMIYSFCTNPATPHQPEEDVPVHAATSDEEDLLDDFFTIPAQEPETAKTDQDEKKTNPEIPVTNRSEMSRLRIQDELLRLTTESGSITQCAAKLLTSYLRDGKDAFSMEEIVVGCAITPSQAGGVINRLRSKRLIRSKGKSSGKYVLYEFNMAVPLLTEGQYDRSVYDALSLMREDGRSRKIRRTAEMLTAYLPAGLIDVHCCPEYSDEEQLKHDMLVPTRMGIVDKICPGVYRIRRNKSKRLPLLSSTQKTLLINLYRTYGDGTFSYAMAAQLQKINSERVSKELHELCLIGIVEREKCNCHLYRLRVNPTDQPSLFAHTESRDAEGAEIPFSPEFHEMLETLDLSKSKSPRDRRLAKALRSCMKKGSISKNDYFLWGYSVSQWAGDIELAEELGLVYKDAEGMRILNRDYRPSRGYLKPRMKKAVTAIYEAFGDKAFTSEMFIATLNYTEAHTYASLHKLALMRIVDQRITKEGTRYCLLVNPEENPECFDAAA